MALNIAISKYKYKAGSKYSFKILFNKTEQQQLTSYKASDIDNTLLF